MISYSYLFIQPYGSAILRAVKVSEVPVCFYEFVITLCYELSKHVIQLTFPIKLDTFHNFPYENETSAVGLIYEF